MFNQTKSTFLHLDLNSCFATIEQQANPLLRGKPIAVAAYTTPRGCILAPSIEAKRFGVKVGMRVSQGKELCPRLIVLPGNPAKYRFVNRALLQLLSKYTPDITVKSIDEMLLKFDQTSLQRKVKNIAGGASRGTPTAGVPLWVALGLASNRTRNNGSNEILNIAQEIKSQIKQDIGEWLTVSVGISTNPYLAKLAANLHKPDGLDEINQDNILDILKTLKLTDLPYIKNQNAFRLLSVGIKTPLDFYYAPQQKLKAAFQSIQSYYWYLRLHGYEVDDVTAKRQSIGHSYALPQPTADLEKLEQILYKLVEKMGRRLRKNNLTTQGIYLACAYKNYGGYHHGEKIPQKIYASRDLYYYAKKMLFNIPDLQPISILAVSCFSLTEDLFDQLTLFKNENKKRALTQALDKINDAWGEFTITQGTTLKMPYQILDRISFGSVLDMSPVILSEEKQWIREKYLEN